MGLIHARSLVFGDDMYRWKILAAQAGPVAAAGLRIIVEQGYVGALTGVGNRQIGSDRGFAAAPLAVDD